MWYFVVIFSDYPLYEKFPRRHVYYPMLISVTIAHSWEAYCCFYIVYRYFRWELTYTYVLNRRTFWAPQILQWLEDTMWSPECISCISDWPGWHWGWRTLQRDVCLIQHYLSLDDCQPWQGRGNKTNIHHSIHKIYKTVFLHSRCKLQYQCLPAEDDIG